MIKWNASPEIVEIAGFSLRYYSLMFVIGFITMGAYVTKRFKHYGRSPELVNSLTNYVIIGMILGSRLAHCLFYEPEIYLRDPILILKVWEGGLASHGGYAGVVAAVWLFLRKHPGVPFLWVMDVLAGPCLFVGGLIRIGNFFNSEIVGLPSDLPWAIVFERLDSIPRHPAQLYEAIGYFSIAGILMFIERKKEFREGGVFVLGITMSFLFRFFIEFTKGEQSTISAAFPINMGQLLSLLFVAVTLVWWKLRRKHT